MKRIIILITGLLFLTLFLPSHMAAQPFPPTPYGGTNQYMYLKEKLDGGYQVAYNRKLNVHYDAPYMVADTQYLLFRVYDRLRNLKASTDESGLDTIASCPRVPICYGENWIILNLSSCVDYYEFYTLEVRNIKGETEFLRFTCVPYTLQIR